MKLKLIYLAVLCAFVPFPAIGGAAAVAAMSAAGSAAMAARRELDRPVSTCYSITNADARIRCQAIERRDPGMCYAIKDPSKRAECRSEAGR